MRYFIKKTKPLREAKAGVGELWIDLDGMREYKFSLWLEDVRVWDDEEEMRQYSNWLYSKENDWENEREEKLDAGGDDIGDFNEDDYDFATFVDLKIYTGETADIEQITFSVDPVSARDPDTSYGDASKAWDFYMLVEDAARAAFDHWKERYHSAGASVSVSGWRVGGDVFEMKLQNKFTDQGGYARDFLEFPGFQFKDLQWSREINPQWIDHNDLADEFIAEIRKMQKRGALVRFRKKEVASTGSIYVSLYVGPEDDEDLIGYRFADHPPAKIRRGGDKWIIFPDELEDELDELKRRYG